MPTNAIVAKAPARFDWRRPFNSWIDGLDGGWSLPLALLGFVAIWFVALILAYSNAGLHPDVLEAWSLGREFAWGNSKHPPLMGWVARIWTAVFPLRDWSFQLLSMVNAATALWLIDLIARRFVKDDKRAVILCLVLLLPTYHFFAQRWNANTVLLAVWPLATYCFLRSFESRSAVWAAAAGAACALAVLGKYYSIFLVLSFIAAAIVHPERRAYLLSAAPSISTLTGLLVLAPHLWWLANNDYATLHFAVSQHGNNSLGESLSSCFSFVGGAFGYLALPAMLWFALCASQWRRALPRFSALGPELRLIALIAIGLLVFPMIAAIQSRTELTPLWTLPSAFLAIIVIVCGSSAVIERFRVRHLLIGLLTFHVAILLLSPLHARYRQAHTNDLSRNVMLDVARQITHLADTDAGVRITIVSGNEPLALATAFYSPQHPTYQTNYDTGGEILLPAETALKPGWTGICLPYNPVCIDWLRKVAEKIPVNQRFEATLAIDSTRVLMVRPAP